MIGFGSFARQLLRDVWTQKLRTFLTIFGIVWGTVAIALLLAFGNGLHRHLVVQSAGLGDRIVIAWPSRTSIPFEGLGRGRQIRMTEEDIDFLKRQLPALHAISSEFNQDLQTTYGERTRAVSVSGVSPEFGEMRNMIPSPGGRFINPLDMTQRRRVAFLGNRIADDLFAGKEPVGKEIVLNGSPFLVVGVLQEKEQDSNYSGPDHSKIMIPSTTFRALTGKRYLDNFIYRAHSPDLNPELSRQVLAALGGRLRFDPQDEEALSVWDTTQMFAFLDAFMLGFKAFLLIMGVLTLTVGAIGVSNIMNVVVEERSREIGIKMALGARASTILRQLLLETLVMTAVGGAIGLAISALICALFPAGLTEHLGTPVLEPELALITALILGAVGLLAGYFPARDASRLDPVVAMKL